MANQNKKRVPLQVAPEFQKMLKDLQRKVIASGTDKSLRDLTEDMARYPTIFNEIECKLIKNEDLGLSIQFDRRRKR